mmetsp:Transcript_23036/g.64811  ORF Transcript_23036/g.64811 Transcript_23036/m.64811 type:complete len:299 (+) Transcript_23036:704-1600(+)
MSAHGDDGALVHLSNGLLWGSTSRIPHDDAAVFRPSDDELAAKAPGSAGDALGMTSEDLHQLACRRPPHPSHGVSRASEDCMPLRVPHDPLHLLRGPIQCVNEISSVGRPNLYRAIVGAGGSILAVIAECDLRHRICVASQSSALHTPQAATRLFLDAPQHRGVVLASGQEHAPVGGAEGDGQHTVRVLYPCLSVVDSRVVTIDLVLLKGALLFHLTVVAVVIRRRGIILVKVDLDALALRELRVQLVGLDGLGALVLDLGHIEVGMPALLSHCAPRAQGWGTLLVRGFPSLTGQPPE